MKDYIEERAIEIAYYIIENNATVRQTAKAFGISKSTVHMDVTKWNGLCGWLSKIVAITFKKIYNKSKVFTREEYVWKEITQSLYARFLVKKVFL